MKRALIEAIITLVIGIIASLVLGNINLIRNPIVSSEAKPTVEQSKEITLELKPVIDSGVMIDLSKELAIKPIIISKVKLVSDPPKVLLKGKATPDMQ